jgi:hypothetical protein
LGKQLQQMRFETIQVSVRGKQVAVPAVRIRDCHLIVTGKWVKLARAHDEEWMETSAATDPAQCIMELRAGGLKADIFTFTEQLPHTQPRFAYPWEWDNIASAPTTNFAKWWEDLPQESRKNVRRSEKRGVTVTTVPFSDELVRGIKGIYDETPVRQGARFWHYQKPFETVKQENGTYLQQSSFLGAFYQGELIGFMKMVFVGPAARMMQIYCKSSHQDKRPANALIAKAVEVCASRGVSSLIYGKYIYGNKRNSPLAEFKRRNGFAEIRLPKYYVPLTLKGKIVVHCKLYRGVSGLLPEGCIDFLLRLRSRFYTYTLLRQNNVSKPAGATEAE